VLVAQSGVLSDSVTITVFAVANTIAITPPAATMPQGDSVQFSAVVRDRHGDPMPAAPVSWMSGDTTIVRISATGRARSVGPVGVVSIAAQSGGLTQFAQVSVTDTNIVARVLINSQPLGVAVSDNVAYVTRFGTNRVQRLNLLTSAVTDSVLVAVGPAFVTFNAAGTTAYVASFFSQSVGLINVATNTQTDTVPVTGEPVPVGVSPGGTALFVTTDANRLYKIALASGSVVDSIALPALSHHLLMNPNDTLLYVATRAGGSVLEVNWRTMAVTRTFTLGGVTQGMAISLDRQELYVADEGANALHIVNLATGLRDTSVALAGAGEGLALSADGTKLYVGLVFAGKVQVIDRVGRTVLTTITTGGTPREIAVDAARSHVLVANEAGWVDIIR